MSDKTIKIYKLFWADQDLEQEQWLRDMARQGLHLAAVNMFCRWTFIQGAPADVVYRVDFANKAKGSDYHVLFADAGWEHAATVTGWHYWRQPVINGRAPEIFTDGESKIARFKQVLLLMALAISPMLIMLVTADKDHAADNVSKGMLYFVLGVVVVSIPLYAYGAARLIRRIRGIRDGGR